MNKTLMSFAVLSLMSASFAQADWCARFNGGACVALDEITAAPFATSLATSLWTGTTSNQKDDNRAIYIQALQDDAAAYLAGADESALLQEAIVQLREKQGLSGSDSEIAASLIGE